MAAEVQVKHHPLMLAAGTKAGMSGHAAPYPWGEQAPLTSCSCSSMGSMTLQGPHLQYDADSHCHNSHVIAEQGGFAAQGCQLLWSRQ